jgi:uncharacterized protein (DUF4415 family)
MAKTKPLTNARGEVRELTRGDFERMQPISALAKSEQKRLLNLKGAAIVHETDTRWEARKRKLNANGNPIGRPPKEEPKVPVTVRLDADVVEFFRAGGNGWQTRLNAFLAAHVKRATKPKRGAAR